MSKTPSQPKLDLDYFEGVILYNALSNQEYLSSIVSYLDDKFFNDKNIGKVLNQVSKFFIERGTLPSSSEIKSRMSSEEDKKALSEVKTKLLSIEGPFNNDELVNNTEKFLKERYIYNTIINIADKFNDSSFKIEETLVDFEKAFNITLKENLGHWYFEDVEKHIKELSSSL